MAALLRSADCIDVRLRRTPGRTQGADRMIELDQARAALSAAQAGLDAATDRWDRYTGNNPNKFKTDIRLARDSVDAAKSRLKAIESRLHERNRNRRRAVARKWLDSNCADPAAAVASCRSAPIEHTSQRVISEVTRPDSRKPKNSLSDLTQQKKRLRFPRSAPTCAAQTAVTRLTYLTRRRPPQPRTPAQSGIVRSGNRDVAHGGSPGWLGDGMSGFGGMLS